MRGDLIVDKERLRELHQRLKKVWESPATTTIAPDNTHVLAMSNAMAIDMILTELTK
jgi:hypothetical protein